MALWLGEHYGQQSSGRMGQVARSAGQTHNPVPDCRAGARLYKAIRVYLSRRLTDVLADLDARGDTEDDASAEMEAAEAQGMTQASAARRQ